MCNMDKSSSVFSYQIGDKIVVLNRIRENQSNSIVYYPKNSWINRRNPEEESKSARIDLANREPDRDENINGRRGVLRSRKGVEDLDQPRCSFNQIKDLNNVLVSLRFFFQNQNN